MRSTQKSRGSSGTRVPRLGGPQSWMHKTRRNHTFPRHRSSSLFTPFHWSSVSISLTYIHSSSPVQSKTMHALAYCLCHTSIAGIHGTAREGPRRMRDCRSRDNHFAGQANGGTSIRE
ncbi:hypothetical protein BDW02DRAFT_175184 [Decorospora gaudefroyi]|uniref:Uncharacterized protein n=1 Tax=Decorospora gaudefroyi TaxID=184978 RepID=A0A6A5KNE7_9PLEO|nr:hypothetical protein BDW02DRAFT_175184 [Decorospora gaudefroyi]